VRSGARNSFKDLKRLYWLLLKKLDMYLSAHAKLCFEQLALVEICCSEGKGKMEHRWGAHLPFRGR